MYFDVDSCFFLLQFATSMQISVTCLNNVANKVHSFSQFTILKYFDFFICGIFLEALSQSRC